MNEQDVCIPGRGPMDAEIVVIGEAPGYRELLQGRPFVGPSGQLQETWMTSVGIDPRAVRYENVYPFYPPDGKIENIDYLELLRWQEDCLVRIDALKDAVILVPVGNVALSTLTGKDRITHWRGSILSYFQQSTRRQVKVIPTIHPAAILYQRRKVAQKYAGAQQGANPLWEKRCRLDWQRIASDSTFSELHIPERKLIITDQDPWINDIWQEIHESSSPLAIDIETIPNEQKITCISFSCNNTVAVSLPFNNKWRAWIQRLCECGVPKILQNGFYDYYWLAKRAGIYINNYVYDTRWMMHLYDPLEPGSLAYMTSIFTREPFYKPTDDEIEEKYWWSSSGAQWYELLAYNARDAVVTREIFGVLRDLIDMDLYQRLYSSLFYPLLRMMLHGVPVDRVECNYSHEESRREALLMRDLACKIAGRPLFKLKTFAEKAIYTDAGSEEIERALKRGKRTREQVEQYIANLTISNQELAGVLRDHGCSIPKSHKNITGETLDDTALKGLKLRYSQSKPVVKELIEAVEQHRKARKLSEFFANGRIDDDTRMRCEYGFTVTNRCRSRHNPLGSGGNLQNIPQAARGVFVPLPGHVFLSVDLSQAEARDVYMRTGDIELIAFARSMPWEIDIHTQNASIFYEVEYDRVTKEQRQESKVIEHATNYGMGARRLQDEFLDNGIVKSVKECERLLARKFLLKPGILEWQQKVRMQILSKRRLINAWGREIRFDYMPLDDKTYQMAYAWCPQSDIGILMNIWGVNILDWHIRVSGYESVLMIQEHDGLTVSCPIDEVYEIAVVLKQELEQELFIDGNALSIPCEFKIATTWRTDKQAIEAGRAIEIKQLPEESEFMNMVKELKG